MAEDDREMEQAELLNAVIAGTVKKQGRGRPKKGSTAVTWAQVGLTRQQVHEWRKLAQIPDEIAEAFMDTRRAEGKTPSRRSVLIHFGLKNVVSDDVFVGSPIGDLAEQLLEPVERFLKNAQMSDKQRRWLIRALRYRLRTIALMADMDENQREPFECSKTRALEAL